MKRKPTVSVSKMPEPETQNESRHAKRGMRNIFRRRENARAAASEDLEREARTAGLSPLGRESRPSHETQAAGNAPQMRNRRRALFAALISLALLIGGTVGFSALVSRLNAVSILSANAGSFALGLALTLACAALIALLPSACKRSAVPSESATEAKDGAALADAKPAFPCRGRFTETEADGAKSVTPYRGNVDASITGTKPSGTSSRMTSFLRKPFPWAPIFGALAAGAEIGLFLLTGSARVSHGRTGTSAGGVWLALWLDAGLALYPALWICGVLPRFESVRAPRLRRWFPPIGAALEAGWLLYARGCTAWMFILNALLLGGLLYAFAGRARAWLPAAAGVFAFSAAARLFGEAAPVYPVSEPFLTGAEAGGLFGSPVLTVFLLFWGLTALTKRVHSRDIPNDPTELGGGMQ